MCVRMCVKIINVCILDSNCTMSASLSAHPITSRIFALHVHSAKSLPSMSAQRVSQNQPHNHIRSHPPSFTLQLISQSPHPISVFHTSHDTILHYTIHSLHILSLSFTPLTTLYYPQSPHPISLFHISHYTILATLYCNYNKGRETYRKSVTNALKEALKKAMLKLC